MTDDKKPQLHMHLPAELDAAMTEITPRLKELPNFRYVKLTRAKVAEIVLSRGLQVLTEELDRLEVGK